jgi:hypothetical protein
VAVDGILGGALASRTTGAGRAAARPIEEARVKMRDFIVSKGDFRAVYGEGESLEVFDDTKAVLCIHEPGNGKESIDERWS